MELDQVVDGVTPQVENRAATLADLRALMTSIREEIAVLRTEPQVDLLTEEARRKIHSLQQEVV